MRERSARLIQLYREGKPLRVIAQEHGGTAQGVRSTIRGMIERGVVERRRKPSPITRGHR